VNFTSSSANCNGCATSGTGNSRARFSRNLSGNLRPTSSLSASSRSSRFVRTRPENTKSADWEAIQEIYLAARPKFVGLAYTILRNREDAEDAVQDAFLSAYRHLSSFEGRSAFTTWFTRIVVNAALMIRRKRKSSGADALPEGSGTEDTPWTEMIPASQRDPEMVCADEEIVGLIDILLGKMSPILREAFFLTYCEELTSTEAGAALGVTTGTFKSRVSRARQHLKEEARRFIERPIRNAKLSCFSFHKGAFRPLAAKPAQLPSAEIALS